jgi:hypothetical protein
MNSSLKSSVRIALCRSEDVRGVMRFLNDRWAENHILSRDEALIRWQYNTVLRDSRPDAPPSILVAWCANDIVGMLGLSFVKWRQAGCTNLCAWTTHWVVVPEMRQSYLSFLLIKRATELAPVIGSLGINDQALKLLPSLGYEIIPEIPRWVAIIDPQKVAALLLASGSEHSCEEEMRASLRARAVRMPTRGAHSEWEVVEWSDDMATDWDAYWESGISADYMGAVRDSSFLRWRYVQHPKFHYRVWVARHSSSARIGGIAVSRFETVKGRSERVLRILDLLGEPPAVTACLLDHLRCEAIEGEAAFADFYCTQAIDGLAEAGFRIENSSTHLFPIPFRLQPLEAGGRPINAGIRLPNSKQGALCDAFSSGALYLTRADADQDRPN